MVQSEPNKWEIFHIPTVQPIQYYSILKRKREFFQLIKLYDAQVRKHGFFHYCSIVPKSISSSWKDEWELRIVFLGDVPSTSFIGFRVNVNSETFIQESNSLQLFLKQSKKVGLYFVCNNCIHVQCGKDAWEIFYHLYGTYLRKYVLTVIGTQFFNHYVYQLCFQNEKQLLNMLFRGSKIIRVSQMSIYYQIHQKRKISVTDLIHMTLNMPEIKRCVVSFDSLSRSNIVDQNIYTVGGSKIHTSKLLICKLKKQKDDRLPDNSQTLFLENVPSPISNFHSKFVSSEIQTYNKGIKNKQSIASSSVPKRKFEEAQNKFEKDSKCPKKFLQEKNDWEQYTSVKPYRVKSYSSLLTSEYTIPHLFEFSCEVDPLSDFYSVHTPSVFLGKNDSTVEATNLKRNSRLDANSLNAVSYREKKLMTNCKKDATNDSSESTQVNLSFSKSISASKYFDQDEASEGFTTAAGKSINISSHAMQAALRLIQGEENQKFAPVEKVSESDFLTAAGASISVSKAAMKAAHKLMQDTITTPSSNTPQAPVEKSVWGDKKSNHVSQSKNKEPTARKIRKSLGGRRRF